MKKIMFVLLAVGITPLAFSEECEDAVDMADSLEFHKMHVECNDDPVVLYDPKSKSSFFKKKSAAVDTYAESEQKSVIKDKEVQADIASKPVSRNTVAAHKSVTATEETDNAGVVFNIREPFTITGGPQSALNGLFVQMANYCPAGWEKLKEWSVPSQGGYYLHYQFQCAE